MQAHIDRHEGFYTLKQSHIDIGEPGEPLTCPLAYCIASHAPYEDLHIEHQTITYECENIELAKEVAWDLYALLWAIDRPEMPITLTNTNTEETILLFDADIRPVYPISIYEYEHYFSAHITDRKDTFMDIWHPHHSFKETDGHIHSEQLNIRYEPHVFPKEQ